MSAYIAVLISSFLLFCASPGSFSVPALAWVALIPFLAAASSTTASRAFKLGLTWGLSHYLLLIYWIVIVLGRYGGLPLWAAGAALVLLALYMALYPALFAMLLARCKDRCALLWLAPSLWVGLDWLRGVLFSGFPWQDIGYTQYNQTWMIQLADLLGHHGLSFLIVLVNSLLLTIFRQQRQFRKPARACRAQLTAAVLTLLLAATYNQFRFSKMTSPAVSSTQEILIGLVQGNIDQSQKWLPEFQQATLDSYVQLSQSIMDHTPSDILIWPETALPFYPMGHRLFEQVTSFVTSNGPRLITGAPHYEHTETPGQVLFYNSAFLIEPETVSSAETGHTIQDRRFARYDKQHLVPFGEYIPFGHLLPEWMPVASSMGSFSPGLSPAPIPCHNANIGVLICYESIFPDLARNRTVQGADLLVNLTNDAWYGRSSAPWQQLGMAVFRAVENRRSLARSANTGISCFVNPAGQLLATSDLFTPAALTATLPLHKEMTFFTGWGHYFPIISLVWALLLLIRPARRSYR